MELGTGLSSQTSAVAGKGQHMVTMLHPSTGPGEKPHQGLVHRNGDAKSWESR